MDLYEEIYTNQTFVNTDLRGQCWKEALQPHFALEQVFSAPHPCIRITFKKIQVPAPPHSESMCLRWGLGTGMIKSPRVSLMCGRSQPAPLTGPWWAPALCSVASSSRPFCQPYSVRSLPISAESEPDCFPHILSVPISKGVCRGFPVPIFHVSGNRTFFFLSSPLSATVSPDIS